MTVKLLVIFRENLLEINWLIRPAFLTFFKQRSSFAVSTTTRSRNEPMAKPLTSWLVPSFSQNNLRLVVLGHCLHVSVTKFQDKFAEINFKYVGQTRTSKDFYQILPYFTCFCEFRGFTWILWLHDGAKYHKPWARRLGAFSKSNNKIIEIPLALIVHFPPALACLQDFDIN